MADDTNEPSAAGEAKALNAALAAEHAAVWGYGVVGATLPADKKKLATEAETAHRDARDGLVALLSEQGADPVDAEGAYELPFPVLSGPTRRRWPSRSRTASPAPTRGCSPRRPSRPRVSERSPPWAPPRCARSRGAPAPGRSP
jgi:hypothetical protein